MSETKAGQNGHEAFDVEYQMPEKNAQPLRDHQGRLRSNLEKYDDDGHPAREGSTLPKVNIHVLRLPLLRISEGGWVSAYAHIVCAVIGSGVLSLPWSMSWLGWPAGVIVIGLFAWITWFCSSLLIDAYRYPTIESTDRNYTYMQACTKYLGRGYAIACGIVQYINMFCTGVGYTLTAGVAATAIVKCDCFHNNPGDPCTFSQTPWIILFGCLQLVLSQIQDIDRVVIMSILATIMSFTYATIGLGLSIAKATQHPDGTGTAGGIPIDDDTTHPIDKVWGIFQALGSVAFAYSFSFILLEITDTIKNPGENGKMKKATLRGIATTTFFYAAIGFIGYAAFGNLAPGNLISGFGFYEPWWLVDIANAAIFVHLLGAFQVWMQPLYGFVDQWIFQTFPNQGWIQYDLFCTKLPGLGVFRLNPVRLVWRSCMVVIITILALLLGNCFNDIIALMGSIGFAPLTVFFPIQMHIVQKNVKMFSPYWIALQSLSLFCWAISIVAAVGSIAGIIHDTQGFAPFQTVA